MLCIICRYRASVCVTFQTQIPHGVLAGLPVFTVGVQSFVCTSCGASGCATTESRCCGSIIVYVAVIHGSFWTSNQRVWGVSGMVVYVLLHGVPTRQRFLKEHKCSCAVWAWAQHACSAWPLGWEPMCDARQRWLCVCLHNMACAVVDCIVLCGVRQAATCRRCMLNAWC